MRRTILGFAVAVSLAVGAAAADRDRVGAECNDGTQSSATGSGACSHHQDVRCWIYNDGSLHEAVE
jgi:hypothetical protein